MLNRMSQSKRLAVSFEFFPPADDSGAAQLWASVQRLAPLRPRFVSVTYGADGSTRSRTHACVRRIASETDLVVAPHLTCIAAERDEVLELASTYWREGRRHIVALRGDLPATAAAPAGAAGTRPTGFAFAADLVRALRGVGDFDISVAAYPEGHPESGSVAADIENLPCGQRNGAIHVSQPQRIEFVQQFRRTVRIPPALRKGREFGYFRRIGILRRRAHGRHLHPAARRIRRPSTLKSAGMASIPKVYRLIGISGLN